MPRSPNSHPAARTLSPKPEYAATRAFTPRPCRASASMIIDATPPHESAASGVRRRSNSGATPTRDGLPWTHWTSGIDCEGAKQVLGLRVGPTTGESAKFWMPVLSELKRRGVADVCIVCCDGLTGLPDAISVTWPQAVVQLCVVHLIRASLRYASKKYWVPLTRDLRPVYTAADEAAAAVALEDFARAWEDRYPAIVRLWRAHWSEFIPFLAFPPEVRRVVYTTNLIESMNARLRKVTRNRGQFPSEQAALKVLYLAVRNLEEFRRPNVGIRSAGWKQALQAFTIYFEGRIPTP
jgi:putative transposase